MLDLATWILTVVIVILGSIARRVDIIEVTRALRILAIGGRNLELLGADLGDPTLYIALGGISHPHQLGVLQHFAHCKGETEKKTLYYIPNQANGQFQKFSFYIYYVRYKRMARDNINAKNLIYLAVPTQREPRNWDSGQVQPTLHTGRVWKDK